MESIAAERTAAAQVGDAGFGIRVSLASTMRAM
jgi:hypothetical protein